MKLDYSIVVIFGSSLLVTLTIAKLEPQKCCRNERNLLLKQRCVNDSTGKSPPIVLTCEEKYILSPTELEEDFYNITENATLYIADMDSYLLSSEYCIVNTQEDDGGGNETYEIAIVCFPQSEHSEIPKISFEIKSIFILISAIFLLLTLYIYYRLPELRETQDKVTIFTITCLMTFMLFLGCLQIYVPYNSKFDICLLISFPTYFFTISYFSWLNCVIANVWKIVVARKWKITESRWYLMNHIYAWTVPIALTTVVAYKHAMKPRLGVTTCWFHHNHDQWTLVYVPISLMLSINVILCVWSSIRLVNPSYTPDTIRALRRKCILYLKLFLLGGLTWIFEVLSYTFNDHSSSAWIWIIFDSLNCLHGVLVFCVLILWRQRIRKELANKKILGFTCPSRWADIDDDEQICLDSEGKGKYDLVVKALK